MNIRKINENILYVGVNDRTTDRFEGLWPLPYGVSYNSYIVKGEKTALIDTVEIGEEHAFISRIHEVIGSDKIDYLIVNHMEPDHSGSIPEILKCYPGLKIVGNKQTISMIKGFYGIDDENVYMEVADGDTLDLGGETLKFYLTPMVHWPETMMTYAENSHTLFSGDAFGTFGALNGGVIDREMNTDIYRRELYRYYSNIVGKYGRHVQRALQKLKDLELAYICSTHGPVWQEELEGVVADVDRLSRYESEDGVTIIYGSMYGNTAYIAEEIAARLAERGIKRICVHNACKSNMSDMISDAFRYKGLIVGSSTYSMRMLPPVEQFLAAMETREVTQKVTACFGSYTWAAGAADAISEMLGKIKMPPVASMKMKQSATEEDLKAARDLADKVADALAL